MRRCIPTKKSESAIGHNSMYAFDSIPAANLKHTFCSGVIRCVQTFVRPGEQRRLVRADVSVDVAKEKGLKNGCVDVVHGAVCHSLGRDRGGDDWPCPPLLLRKTAPKMELVDAQPSERDCFAFRRASCSDIRSSFQSLCFGQADEILNPLQSTVSSHAFLQPRSPAGSLSRATTKDWPRSYASLISWLGTVAPAQLTTAQASPQQAWIVR